MIQVTTHSYNYSTGEKQVYTLQQYLKRSDTFSYAGALETVSSQLEQTQDKFANLLSHLYERKIIDERALCKILDDSELEVVPVPKPPKVKKAVRVDRVFKLGDIVKYGNSNYDLMKVESIHKRVLFGPTYYGVGKKAFWGNCKLAGRSDLRIWRDRRGITK